MSQPELSVVIPAYNEAENVPLLAEEIPRDFVPGDHPGIVEVGPATVGSVMCFEVAFDSAIREVTGDHVDLLAVRTFRVEGHLAKPTSIIVDESGIVRWAYVGRQPADRPSAAELIEALDRLSRPPGR